MAKNGMNSSKGLKKPSAVQKTTEELIMNLVDSPTEAPIDRQPSKKQVDFDLDLDTQIPST